MRRERGAVSQIRNYDTGVANSNTHTRIRLRILSSSLVREPPSVRNRLGEKKVQGTYTSVVAGACPAHHDLLGIPSVFPVLLMCVNVKGAPPKAAEVVKMKSKPKAEVGEVRGTVTAARASVGVRTSVIASFLR